MHRKGRKLPRDWKGEDLKFSIAGEAGLVDVLEDTVRALERKHAMERELLIYMLQGRESVQARSAAKKLNAGKFTRVLSNNIKHEEGCLGFPNTKKWVEKMRRSRVRGVWIPDETLF